MSNRQRGLADWLEYISGRHPREIELGLHRSRQVADALGLLPLAPRTLTIAGTNGKGSTTRFAEALLLADGQRVGATLSPHLHRFNERVRIAGNEATDQALCGAFAAVDAARADVPLTYYEFSILAAMWLFREAELDAVILEVGLGGRLDTVNIADADVAVVTNIGLDHQEYLGDTLDAIGSEKAAIARAGRPLLLGDTNLPSSVTSYAAAIGAPVSCYGRDFWTGATATGWLFAAPGRPARYLAGRPMVALRNAGLAVAAVEALCGEPAATTVLQAASDQVRHPGRFEAFRWRGVAGVLDVAHNPAGAAFLAAQLKARWPGRRLVACAGMLADKDVAGIVEALRPLIAHWVLCDTPGPRGLAAADLAERGGLPAAECCVDARAGLDRAHAACTTADIMVVFGAFVQVQKAREQLLEGRPQPARIEA